jgi:peptidoglycan hydrolase-like protein with peptidoglycan-binding domain
MLLGILVLITALTISAVAIYYSVAGLVAIFASAAIPIMIMGGALEVAKLVTAVWLHKYWKQATWWLKSYLTIAVIVLMFITSMGIFGFLSKAHIDQTAAASEGIAQIERIDLEIQRLQNVIERAESEIASLESSGIAQDNTIQEQIDREQVRIDSAYQRIQPAIDEQNLIVERAESDIRRRVEEIQSQISIINQRLTSLDAALSSNDVRVAQGIVGVRQDGSLGSDTERAIREFRSQQESQINQLTQRIDALTSAPSPLADAARAEIQRLRALAENEIADSNALISRLRAQIGSIDVESIASDIEEKQEIVNESLQTITELEEQKFTLEAEYRKLEAEVGPIKYLAEFIYGESTDKDLLEEAVRWVILIIIFVFDPLAVLLLIASQYTFEINKKKKEHLPLDDEIKDEISTRLDTQQTDLSTVEYRESDKGIATVLADTGNRPNEVRVDNGEVEELLRPVRTESEQRRLEEERIRHIEESEKLETYKSSKLRWKADHPDKTIKEFKEAFIQGRIDHLPWEGYIQNSEQKTDSLWNKIRNNDE